MAKAWSRGLLSIWTFLAVLLISSGWGCLAYYSLADVLHWYSRASTGLHKDLLRFEEIKEAGTIHAPIPFVTITNSNNTADQASKPVALLVFGEHAREVITTETGLWLSKVLVGDTVEIGAWPELKEALAALGVSTDQPEAVLKEWSSYVLENLAVKIMPVENIEGRRSWEAGDLCLRKTPWGVDLNRNYPFAWRKEDPATEMYGGQHPFSEHHSRLVREIALKKVPKAFVNVHSGEWAVYSPWDSKKAIGPGLPGDLGQLLDSMGTVCKCQTGPAGAVSNYLAFGTSMDYMYTQLGVPYSLTLELYGTGNVGQLLPGQKNTPIDDFPFTSDPGIATELPKRSLATTITSVRRGDGHHMRRHRRARAATLRGLNAVSGMESAGYGGLGAVASGLGGPAQVVSSIDELVNSRPGLSRCFHLYNPAMGPQYQDVVARWVVALLAMLKHVADPAHPKASAHPLPGTVLSGDGGGTGGRRSVMHSQLLQQQGPAVSSATTSASLLLTAAAVAANSAGGASEEVAVAGSSGSSSSSDASATAGSRTLQDVLQAGAGGGGSGGRRVLGTADDNTMSARWQVEHQRQGQRSGGNVVAAGRRRLLASSSWSVADRAWAGARLGIGGGGGGIVSVTAPSAESLRRDREAAPRELLQAQQQQVQIQQQQRLASHHIPVHGDGQLQGQQRQQQQQGQPQQFSGEVLGGAQEPVAASATAGTSAVDVAAAAQAMSATNGGVSIGASAGTSGVESGRSTGSASHAKHDHQQHQLPLQQSSHSELDDRRVQQLAGMHGMHIASMAHTHDGAVAAGAGVEGDTSIKSLDSATMYHGDDDDDDDNDKEEDGDGSGDGGHAKVGGDKSAAAGGSVAGRGRSSRWKKQRQQQQVKDSASKAGTSVGGTAAVLPAADDGRSGSGSSLRHDGGRQRTSARDGAIARPERAHLQQPAAEPQLAIGQQQQQRQRREPAALAGMSGSNVDIALPASDPTGQDHHASAARRSGVGSSSGTLVVAQPGSGQAQAQAHQQEEQQEEEEQEEEGQQYELGHDGQPAQRRSMRAQAHPRSHRHHHHHSSHSSGGTYHSSPELRAHSVVVFGALLALMAVVAPALVCSMGPGSGSSRHGQRWRLERLDRLDRL